MKAKKLWFADGRLFIETDKGEKLSQSLKWYPRLAGATDAQREAYRLSPVGIHWAELDEDVSFESFAYPDEEPAENRLAVFFNQHPEINVSKLAQRIGIPRSVFASYLCGAKTPSKERIKQIENALRNVGNELSAVSL